MVYSAILCKNTGVGCRFLLQGIFPIQGSKLLLLHLLHWQVVLYLCASWEAHTVWWFHINAHCEMITTSKLISIHYLVWYGNYLLLLFTSLHPPLATASFVSVFMLLLLFSRVWLFATPWTVACQALRSMGLSRQEYWSGLPFPTPGNLPKPGMEPASLMSPVLAGFFTSSTSWEATVPSGKPPKSGGDYT